MSIRKVRTVQGTKCTAVIYKDSDWGEYLVRFSYPAPVGYVKDCDYFTNDFTDALGTAYAEAGLEQCSEYSEYSECSGGSNA